MVADGWVLHSRFVSSLQTSTLFCVTHKDFRDVSVPASASSCTCKECYFHPVPPCSLFLIYHHCSSAQRVPIAQLELQSFPHGMDLYWPVNFSFGSCCLQLQLVSWSFLQAHLSLLYFVHQQLDFLQRSAVQEGNKPGVVAVCSSTTTLG